MKKIATKHLNVEGEEMIVIEVKVDELDDEQEYMVQRAVEELTRYILRMKGIMSPECGGCSGC